MQRIWPSCAGLPSGLVIVRRISIAMAAENVVVVAEVQVTDGGAGQGLSTDAVGAAAWARHREERLLSQQPQKSMSGVPGAKFLHRHWRRASNNVPVFLVLDTHSNR